MTLDQTCLHLYNDEYKLDLAYQEMKALDALINAEGNILHHDSMAESMGLNIKLYDSRVLEKSISRLRNKNQKNTLALTSFTVFVVMAIDCFEESYQSIKQTFTLKGLGHGAQQASYRARKTSHWYSSGNRF
ncbi:hypothetical protein ACFS4T_13100 [Pseudomonas lini]